MKFSCYVGSPPETAARGYNSDPELNNVSGYNEHNNYDKIFNGYFIKLFLESRKHR